jgi:hypothetical protein
MRMRTMRKKVRKKIDSGLIVAREEDVPLVL